MGVLLEKLKAKDMINDRIKNKYIICKSKEHGEEIINFFMENGAINPYERSGTAVGLAYFVNQEGSVDYYRHAPSAIEIGYTEMFLPEEQEMKRGDLVDVSDNEYAWSSKPRIFLAKIDRDTYPFITVDRGDEDKFNKGLSFIASCWKHARPHVPTITLEEAEKLLGKKIVLTQN